MLITETSLVDRLHKLSTRAVLFVTGGGLEIFKMLTHRGGGSATLLSGMIPYTQEETYDLLGFKPTKLVSEQTTRQMAMAAYRRADKLAAKREPIVLPDCYPASVRQRSIWVSDKQYPTVGIAANMVLQKTPDERIGREHTVYVAIQTDSKTVALTLHLNDSEKLSGTSTAELIRVWEESIAARLILNAIAEAFGSQDRVSLGYGLDKRVERNESTIRSSYFRPFMLGEINRLAWNINSDGTLGDLSAPEEAYCDHNGIAPARFMLPGSFNPQHDGHRTMARLTSEANEDCFVPRVDFEISVANVDKAPLDIIEIENRLRSIKSGTEDSCHVWLTKAPTFVEKSNMFPNVTFIVGYDTALRICDPKYAGDIETVCETFRKNNTRFIVFGRTQNGVYKSGLDEFPECFRRLATAMDTPSDIAAISSTALRSQSVAI